MIYTLGAHVGWVGDAGLQANGMKPFSTMSTCPPLVPVPENRRQGSKILVVMCGLDKKVGSLIALA